ncbi:hypothetical protein FRC00_014176, partial [Tulasnella sp. 408]
SQDTSYGTATNGKRIQIFDNLRIGASRTNDKPIWLADDIFTTPKTSHVVTTEPKFEFQPPQEDGKAEDEFPRMMDMEQALDEATIYKGLLLAGANTLSTTIQYCPSPSPGEAYTSN